jgi:anti-sigma factor RsiW
MTCSEAREYLFAFLDSELDAPLSIELQRHLDGCADCAREAEIERTTRKRLAEALDATGDRIPSLEDALGVSLVRRENAAPAEAHRLDHTIRRRRFPAMAASLLLVAMGAGAWYVAFAPRVTPSPSFVQLVAADFEHFLGEGSKLQVASDDRDTVTDWLRERTGVAIVLPSLGDTAGRLLGGRKCTISGQPAAFAVYDINGTPVSLVAVRAEQFDAGEPAGVVSETPSHRTDRLNGYTIVTRRSDDLVYAAVSTLPVDELLFVISGKLHESD